MIFSLVLVFSSTAKNARVAKLVDAQDLKSWGSIISAVPVQVRPRAPLQRFHVLSSYYHQSSKPDQSSEKEGVRALCDTRVTHTRSILSSIIITQFFIKDFILGAEHGEAFY